DVRQQRAQLDVAAANLSRAWTLLDGIDVSVLGADPRLERVARILATARAEQADIADALALAAPERGEALLGGHGARAVVLRVSGPTPSSQAYAVVDEGRLARVDVDQPPAPPIAMLVVDPATLVELQAAMPVAGSMNASTAADIARAILAQS